MPQLGPNGKDRHYYMAYKLGGVLTDVTKDVCGQITDALWNEAKPQKVRRGSNCRHMGKRVL